MNKKIYLSALVLPAVFAACTQDDLSDLNYNKTQSRVVLDEVTFAEEMESRLAFDGSSFNTITLKTGDEVGAYLIDSPSDILTDEELSTLRASASKDLDIEQGLKAGYTINTYINGSHKFVYDKTTGWNTLDQMVEGSYIYVLPYQDKKTREPITTALPQIQYLKYKEGTKELDDRSLMTQLIESGQPLAVGYEFLSRYNSQVSGALKQIYAYPRITFKNDFAESVTIQKIIINSASKFALEGTINIKNASDELMRLDSDPKADDLKNSTVAGNWTKSVQGNYYIDENYTADIVTPVDASKKDFIVVVAPENLTVASEASISFQAVIPAAAYAKDDITIDVYTNKGVFQQTLNAVKLNNGLRYSSSNYSEGSLKANSAADKYGNGAFTQGSDMTVEQDKIKKLDQVVVIDTNDLLAVINGEVEGTTAVPNKIKVAPLNTVAINKDVVAALGDKKGLIVTQDVDIEGTEEGLTIKNIDFEENTATVTEGLVAFKDVAIASLAIEEGATVAVDKNFAGKPDVENKGTLNVSAYENNGSPMTSELGDVINWGTLNVSTALKAGTVCNGADKTPAYDEVVTSAAINALANITATVENYGALNVKNSISVTTINNNKATKTDCADKEGIVTVNAGKMLKTGGSNAGTIDVNGEFRAVTAFENNGDINNNYGIENEAGVKLNNTKDGYITVAADAKYTSVNDNAGIIEILNRQSEIHSDNNYGTIMYTAETGGTFVVMATDKYNAVKFNESTALMVQMTTGNNPVAVQAALELANKLTVVANAEGVYSFVTNIAGLSISDNVYATIDSDLTITESVNIGSGATLHLGTDNTMNYKKSEGFVNNGTFRNMGILTAMCNKPATGTWTGSGLYSWGNVNADATSELQAALSKPENAGGTVTLNEGVILNQSLTVVQNLTLDMNGKTLQMSTNSATYGAAIEANGSGKTLTIDGDGFIDGGKDDNGKNSYRNAVVAKNGATINIKSGTYTLTQGANALIYAEQGTINISGGYFYIANEKDPVDPGTNDAYCLLNCLDANYNNGTANIIVTGGVFKNFNPANNFAEGANTSFINKLTHKVVSYKDEACTQQQNPDAKQAWPGGTNYWYKVVER